MYETIPFLVLFIFTLSSFAEVIKDNSVDRNGYEVIHVDNPIVDDKIVEIYCLGDTIDVKCKVSYGPISRKEPPKQCFFTDKVDPNWISKSLKSLVNGPLTHMNYLDKPFVVALKNNKAVIGWLEKYVDIPMYRLRLKNVKFDDCHVTEGSVDLGFQIDQAFINIESKDNGGYEVIVGNYDSACDGKMCSMLADQDGKLSGSYEERREETEIVAKHESWIYNTPKNKLLKYAKMARLKLVTKVSDSNNNVDKWYAEYYNGGYGFNGYRQYRLMKKSDLVYSMIDGSTSLFTACYSHNFRNTFVVDCEQTDIPGSLNNFFSRFFYRLKKDNENQKVAIKSLPSGGALVAIIGEKGDFFKVTVLDVRGKRHRVLIREFSGCDATLRDSYVTASIYEEHNGDKILYCIKEICESQRISNLQEFKFDKDSNCFTLRDILLND